MLGSLPPHLFKQYNLRKFFLFFYHFEDKQGKVYKTTQLIYIGNDTLALLIIVQCSYILREHI